MRKLDLKATFPRPRAAAEDFENEPRAVDDLDAPGALEVALRSTARSPGKAARTRSEKSIDSSLE